MAQMTTSEIITQDVYPVDWCEDTVNLEPIDLIRAELPPRCRVCPKLQSRLGEMAF